MKTYGTMKIVSEFQTIQRNGPKYCIKNENSCLFKTCRWWNVSEFEKSTLIEQNYEFKLLSQKHCNEKYLD